MNTKRQETKPRIFSRRDILAGSAALFAGGLIGGATVADASSNSTNPPETLHHYPGSGLNSILWR